MYQHLATIKEDLDFRLENLTKLPRSESSLEVLQNLPVLEKKYLKTHYIGHEWNIGSINVLSLLQNANILTMSQYICNQHDLEEDAEGTQLILNDLLEIEFNLLANLIKNLSCNNIHSIKVTQLLEEAFQRYINDTICDENISQRSPQRSSNYLQQVATHLTPHDLEAVKTLHLKLFLEQDKTNIADAVKLQREWNIIEIPCSTANIMSSIITDNAATLAHLFNFAKSTNFEGWKWYLLFLHLIVADIKVQTEHFSLINKYLKELFQMYLQNKCDSLFYIMMITARQVCKFSNGQHSYFRDYGTWYKQTISEMRYHQKPDEFRATIKTMVSMIKFENDQDILKIHANTAIPAPTHCSELVVNFKLLSKSLLIDLTADADGSVIIDE